MDKRLPCELSEEEMVAAEERFPELAAKAGQAAYEEAIEKTGAVMVVDEDNFLVMRFRDGRSRVIRRMEDEVQVRPSSTLYRIKRAA